jgi:hypothetical protein
MPSKTEKQRRYFGYIYSLKKAGKKSKKWKDASKKSKNIVNTMDSETIKDFLKTESKYLMSFEEFIFKLL